MKAYTIILAKGNSERIKNKNLYKINGVPLLKYSIDHSKNSKLVTKTFVSSDSVEIENLVNKNKINFIKRPKYLCQKTSTSEQGLVHALNNIIKNFEIPDYIVFLQVTSPFRKKMTLIIVLIN